MDINILLTALEKSRSPHFNERNNAEDIMQNARGRDGFCQALLIIANNQEVSILLINLKISMENRIAAVIALDLEVKEAWKKDPSKGGVQINDRQFIKENIMDTITINLSNKPMK